MTYFYLADRRPTENQIAKALYEFAAHEANDTPLDEIARLMDTTIGSVCAYRRMLHQVMGEA